MFSVSRRGLLAGAASLSALALASCSSSGEFADAPSSAASSQPSSAPASSPAAGSASSEAEEAVFPATIKHKFGETTVTAKPTRVAVVGYSDQDFVLAFGAKPVLVRNWYGPDQVFQPWTKPYSDGLTIKGTDLGSDGIDVEKVAAVNPDLIIGVYSGMTKDDYTKLSRLAPVIAQEAEFIDYGEPWDHVTRQIGTALGQPQKAEQLITDLKKKFADTKAANPQWAGKSLSVATFDGKNSLASFAGTDVRSRFFTELGFTTSAEIDTLAGDKFYASIPLEKASVLDQDLIVWDQLSFTEGGQATIGKTPALANLKAFKENRIVYLSPVDVETAFGWQTILSLPYALDKVVGLIQKALPPQ